MKASLTRAFTVEYSLKISFYGLNTTLVLSKIRSEYGLSDKHLAYHNIDQDQSTQSSLPTKMFIFISNDRYYISTRETLIETLVYILQGSASRRVRNKFRLRRKMKDC